MSGRRERVAVLMMQVQQQTRNNQDVVRKRKLTRAQKFSKNLLTAENVPKSLTLAMQVQSECNHDGCAQEYVKNTCAIFEEEREATEKLRLRDLCCWLVVESAAQRAAGLQGTRKRFAVCINCLCNEGVVC